MDNSKVLCHHTNLKVWHKFETETIFEQPKNLYNNSQIKIQDIVINDVAIEYYNCRTTRHDKNAWSWIFIPEIPRKLNIFREYQVFSYDQTADIFKYKDRILFIDYIKKLFLTNIEQLKSERIRRK